MPDDRVFYRGLLSEELVVMGGPHTDLDPSREVAFAEFVEMPLVIPRSPPTGIGHALENAALRTKVTIQYHTATDSLQVTKSLIEAGLAYAALPPLSACVREVDDDRIRYAPPLSGPALTQHLGVAATAQLDLPREFTAKVGETLRGGETSRLIESGRWPARLLTREPWDPNTA